MNKTLRRFAAIAATSSLLFVSACGGGGRPSADEVKEGLTNGGISQFKAFESLPPEVLDCIAKAFVDSDLSDETLQAIVDGDEGYEPPEEEREAAAGLQGDAKTCAEDAMGAGSSEG